MTTRHLATSSRRAAAAVAALVLPLSLAACGEDDGKAKQAPAAAPDTPAKAYAEFAKAVADGDADAFADATVKGFHSDIGDSDVASLAGLVEAGDLLLPASADDVKIAESTAFMEANGLDETWLASVSASAKTEKLTEDDVAAVTVPDGNVREDDDLAVLLVRDKGDWRAWLVE